MSFVLHQKPPLTAPLSGPLTPPSTTSPTTSSTTPSTTSGPQRAMHNAHRKTTAPATSWLNWLPSAVIFSIIIISFHPFDAAFSPTQPQSIEGDIVNQIGFATIGLCCGFLVLTQISHQAASAWFTPLWLCTLCFLLVSIFNAPAPSSALRAAIYTLLITFAIYTALALPRSVANMVSLLSFSSLLTLGFCYFAVFFMPEQGVHQTGGVEANHAGLWRGIFSHKNIATYVIAIFILFSIFILRYKRPVLGLIILLLSCIFVVNAGSKAGMISLPFAILIVMMARWVTWRPLKALILIAPIIGFMTLTLGAVIFPSILQALRTIIPELTYTGRTDIWTFGLEYLQKQLWFGYGLGGFWTPQMRITMVQPIELAWDVRGIVHGHHAWLDVALAMGLLAAICIFLTFVILPIRDYIAIGTEGNAGRLAQLYATIWLYILFGANFESFFFSRADPLWVLLLFGIIGLRITAHMSKRQL